MFVLTFDENRAFVRREVPEPVRKENEILIQISAAALNRADLLQREGSYPPPPGWPEWPGLEVAGEVLECDAACRFRPGDRVCALLGGGGYAERVTVPQELVIPVPAGMSMAEAAAIPEVFATAYLNLVIEGGIRSGDTVFIQAGASGLGLAAIQLVKTFGGRVVTTVGSDEKAAYVTSLGADRVINHRIDNPVEMLHRDPPDIALDCVGGPALPDYLAAMKPGGRWIILATLGGARAEIDLGMLFRNRIRLIGSSLRSRTTAEKGRIMTALKEEFLPKFSSGELRSILHRTMPFAEVEEAHRILRDRENIGKVVLTSPI